MEASCSSRVQVGAELEWALSTIAELALFDYYYDYYQYEDKPAVDKPVTGCIERTKSKNTTTDASPRRRRLVKPTPMSDYMCSEATPVSDNVCPEVRVPLQKPDEEDRKLKSKAADCCDNFAEPHREAPVLLHSISLLRRVEGVLQQAQKGAIPVEVLHQRLAAVCSQKKAGLAGLPCGASVDDALREVGKEGGACNWTLIDADGLGLHGAGRGGIEEMTSRLADDKVLFGVLRLSFNVNSQHPKKAASGFSTFGASNACNRSKSVSHVFVHWVGPTVSAVRRGLSNAKCLKAVAMAKKYCTLTVQRHASSIKDLGIEDIVKDLRYVKALGAADCSGLQGGISAKEYFRFLHEEEGEARVPLQTDGENWKLKSEADWSVPLQKPDDEDRKLQSEVASYLHSGKILAPMGLHI